MAEEIVKLPLEIVPRGKQDLLYSILLAIRNGGSGGGFVNPMSGEGDLIVGGSGGLPESLEIGTDGQILTVVMGSAAWADPVGGGIPAGSLMAYAGATTPAGWLLCYGQEVSRDTYAGLFTAIGITYGAGDGTTTFILPDLRGRVAAGKDDMGGSASGALTFGGADSLGYTFGFETASLDLTLMPAHSHSMDFATVTVSQQSADVDVFSGPGNTGSGGLTGDQGGTMAHNNLQPLMILNYIIKT